MIKRSSQVVDELIVAVLKNNTKNPLFSVEERVTMLEKLSQSFPNVSVRSFDGLTADFARENGATIVVRGLRAVTDFEYELQVAQTNHVINDNIDTIFLVSNLRYSYLSSTIVKEVASYGGDISNFVPKEIMDQIYKKFSV